MTRSPFTPADRNMPGFRMLFLVATAAVMLALFSAHLVAQTKPGKTIAGAAKPAPAIMIDRLTKEADVVAVGRVSEMRAEWTEDKSRIQTRVTVAVDQTLKGAPGQETITLVVPGGEVDGVGEMYSHMAQFQRNEEVLVFATKDAKGDLRVTSGLDGKVALQKDAKTGILSVPNLGNIDEVSARIIQSAKNQATEPKRN